MIVLGSLFAMALSLTSTSSLCHNCCAAPRPLCAVELLVCSVHHFLAVEIG